MNLFLENFARNVAKRPHEIAIEDDHDRLSFEDLNNAANALAQTLIDTTDPAEIVGFLKTSMVAKTVVAVAAIKAGRTYVTLAPEDSPQKRDAILSTAKVSKILVKDAQAASVVRAMGASPVLFTLAASGPDLSLEVPSDHLVWLEATSGSTGAPKLVGVDRATLQHYLSAQTRTSEIGASDRIANFGEIWLDTFLVGLNTGAATYHFDLRQKGIGHLDGWMREKRITAMQTYVAAFRALASASEGVFPDLKIVRLAGELVTQPDVTAFEAMTPRDAKLTNYLGSTECSFIAYHQHKHGAPVPDKGLPVGTIIEGTRIEIQDERGRPMPPESVGVLIVKSKFLATAYFNNPEKTKGVYWQEPDGTRVLNTNDLGWVSRDGQLTLVGRADDQVKIRGYSVRYSEIEAVLNAVEGVSLGAVSSHLTPTGIRYLCAHYEGPRALAAQDLKAALAEALPSYMVPNYYVHHETLPRTDTGKVLRRALDAPTRATQGSVSHAKWPPLEKRIASEWERVLGHAEFSADDDFFDIGGDSLQAMDMLLAVERREQRPIGYENLVLKGASVAQIAAYLQAASPAIVPLRPQDGGTPLYLLPVENSEFSPWLRICQALPSGISVHGVHARDPDLLTNIPVLSAEEMGRRAAETILAEHTDGPFFLAGYSAGTHTALETARALLSRGAAPAGLILLDPTLPEIEPFSRTWRFRRLLSPVLKRRDLATSVQRFRHIYLGGTTDELPIADERAFYTYRLKNGPVSPVLMFVCLEENPRRAEKESAWRRCVDPDAEVRSLDCNHQHIVRDPNAAQVAGMLAEWLRETIAKKTPPAS